MDQQYRGVKRYPGPKEQEGGKATREKIEVEPRRAQASFQGLVTRAPPPQVDTFLDTQTMRGTGCHMSWGGKLLAPMPKSKVGVASEMG